MAVKASTHCEKAVTAPQLKRKMERSTAINAQLINLQQVAQAAYFSRISSHPFSIFKSAKYEPVFVMKNQVPFLSSQPTEEYLFPKDMYPKNALENT
jgi:hypothetical protein